jgi:hypothetical protein
MADAGTTDSYQDLPCTGRWLHYIGDPSGLSDTDESNGSHG